jgi:hypothetical protein
MNKQTDDLHYGICAEVSLFEKMKTVFGADVKQSTSKYSLYDYYSENVFIELKTRRNAKARYPDTMIGMNKIKFFLGQSRKCFSVFNFTDGVYYIEINEESTKKFIYKNGGRSDRGRLEIKEYCYIPVDLLIPLTV